MGFVGLLAGCDVLLCKPGYGSFIEASCSDVPVLYAERPDWPKSSALVEWLQNHGRCRNIPRQTLEDGNIATEMELLREMARPPTPVPSGGEQVAKWLFARLEI